MNICASIFGCGRESKRDICEHCGGRTVEYSSLELFMRDCGTLPDVQSFERAYKAVSGHGMGLMAKEHYLRKHAIIDITEETRDPYMNKFRIKEEPKIETLENIEDAFKRKT